MLSRHLHSQRCTNYPLRMQNTLGYTPTRWNTISQMVRTVRATPREWFGRIWLWASLVLVVATVSPLTQVSSQYWIDWLYPLSYFWWGKVRFGVDVWFTYGPWGFVWGGYYPTTFALTCTFWFGYALLVWASARQAFEAAVGPGRPLAAGALLMLWGMLLGGDHSCFADARFFLLPLLLLVNHFYLRRSPGDWLTIALTAMVGFTGAVKFTYLLTGGIAVAAVAADELRRTPRKCRAIPIALAVFLLAWTAGGQSLLNLPAYVRTSLEIVRGYSEAMNITVDYDSRQLWLYNVAFLGLIVLIAAHRDVAGWWIFGGALSAIAMLVFRASFVRWDEHAVIASGFAVTAVPLVVATLWFRLKTYGRVIAAGCILMAFATQVITANRWDPSKMPYSPVHAVATIGRYFTEGWLVATGRPVTVAVDYQRFMSHTASTLPLLPVRGTVDIVPHELSSVFAAGLQYLPRPTVQGYVAYTPLLARANAAFYASEKRPDHVFFRPVSIDGRLPSLEDPQLWLELMRSYRLMGQTPAYLHLVPTAHPRELAISPLVSFEATLGERFDLPAMPKHKLIWGRIRLASHAGARVLSQLYKPPRVWIELTIGVGQPVVARMIVENAADGFLLSPLIVNNEVSADVFNRMTLPPYLDDWRVRSIRVVAEPSSWANLYYEPKLQVDLSELSIRGGPIPAGATNQIP